MIYMCTCKYTGETHFADSKEPFINRCGECTPKTVNIENLKELAKEINSQKSKLDKKTD